MAKRQNVGSPFNQQAQVVVDAASNYIMGNGDDVVEVTAGGVTVFLPPHPNVGQEHRIVAAVFSAVVDGNGHTIESGETAVPATTAKDFTFSSNDTWIPTVGIGSG